MTGSQRTSGGHGGKSENKRGHGGKSENKRGHDEKSENKRGHGWKSENKRGHGGKSENKRGSWREVREQAGVMAGGQRTSWGHGGKSENKRGSWRVVKSENKLGSWRMVKSSWGHGRSSRTSGGHGRSQRTSGGHGGMSENKRGSWREVREQAGVTARGQSGRPEVSLRAVRLSPNCRGRAVPPSHVTRVLISRRHRDAGVLNHWHVSQHSGWPPCSWSQLAVSLLGHGQIDWPTSSFTLFDVHRNHIRPVRQGGGGVTMYNCLQTCTVHKIHESSETHHTSPSGTHYASHHVHITSRRKYITQIRNTSHKSSGTVHK